MNVDQEQTQAELARAEKSLHAMYARHSPRVGHAIEPRFGAIYSRAAARLEMLKIIYARLYETSHALNAIDAEMELKYPGGNVQGIPLSADLVDSMAKVQDMAWRFQLDHDSMLIFGSMLLDDWSLLVAIAQGFEIGTFETLLNLVQGNQCPRSLAAFRDSKQNGVASYLCLAVRTLRNKLVMHQSNTYQRGMSRHPTHPLVFINYTVPEGLLPLPTVVEQDVKGVRTQFKLKLKPDATPQDIAATLLGMSHEVTSQSERQVITKFIETYGVTNPIFQLIYHRLTEFVNEASPLC